MALVPGAALPAQRDLVCNARSDACGGFIIVINSDAGAVRRQGPRALRALAQRTLGGQLASVVTTDRHDLVAALQAAARQAPRAVAVIGGDGTARTALQTLSPLDIPVAPLPGGTLNRLTKRVFGHGSIEACLQAMRYGTSRPLAGARVEGHRFYVAAGFGAWMQLQTVRERMRGKNPVAGLRLLLRLAPHQFAERLHWSPNEAAPLVNSTLIVGVGRIDSALGTHAQMHEPALLEAAGADVRDWGGLAGVAASTLLRRWRRHRDVTTLAARSVTVTSGHGGTPALLDGEYHMLGRNFDIVFENNCGRVWAPVRRRRPW